MNFKIIPLILAACSFLFYFSCATPSDAEINALCELSALWNCPENCSIGCDVCGSTCNTGLSSITQLYIFGKNLTKLPESISNFTNLDYLKLPQNHISTLPESFEKLTSLVHLYLSYNNFISIPESLGKLVSLTELFLNSNLLTSLPDSIGNLTKLEYFIIINNQVTSFPNSIKNLNIGYFEFSYNFINCTRLMLENISFINYCGDQNDCHNWDGNKTACGRWIVCNWNISTNTCDWKINEQQLIQSSSYQTINEISSSSSENKQNSVTVIISFDSITVSEIDNLKNDIGNIFNIDINEINVVLISSNEVQITIYGQSLSIIQQNANELIEIINNQNCNN